MQAVTTIGLDIAKSIFQIHGVDAAGNVIVRRQLKRRYVLPSFPEATAVPRRHRSLRLVSSLVARTAGSWSYGALDAAVSGICVPLTSVLSCLAEKVDRAPPAGTPAHDLLPLFASHIVVGPIGAISDAERPVRL